MMKTLGVILFCISACFAKSSLDHQWNQWKDKYGQTYSSITVEAVRRLAWERNFYLVKEHNENINSEFKLAMNQFSAEGHSSRNKFYPSDGNKRGEEEMEHNWTHLPSSFDWRKKGAISAVKNQGQMGSVLAISAIECMESFSYIKLGKLSSLSRQEIVDCCTQGTVIPVFDCIHNIGGLCSEAEYPSTPGSCRNSSCSSVVQNQGTQIVPKGREDQLQIAVLQFPVMALIDASRPSFQMYRKGIYNDPSCSSTELDHAVQIVGYGSEDGKDYWIVKNSWGADWGMDGYILMSRNKNNQCGIASAASFPV